MVCSASGWILRHEDANTETFATVAQQSGSTRLYPVGTLNPQQYLGWRTELDRCVANDVVAYRFFPDQQHWQPDDSEGFRTIASALRGGPPLLISVDRSTDATRVGRGTADLGVPVVLVGSHYTQFADCLAALERWPHLYLETSRMAHFRAVETVVERVGGQRLLFGSGAPKRPVQAALNAVLTASISEADRDDILWHNACRLFGLAVDSPPPLPGATRAQDLVDAHGHVGSVGMALAPFDPDIFIQRATRLGVSLTVASSSRAIFYDLEQGNREALETAEHRTEALRTYVVVNPNDLEGSCQAMDSAYRRDVVVGAKLHCQWSGSVTASNATRELLREVARRGRPLKIHNDGPAWAETLMEFARAFPDWSVIIAHAGLGTPSVDAARAVEQTDNIYLELATSFPNLPVVREVVRRAGSDRLLFGSDAPLIDQAYVLGIYADSGADLKRTTVNAKRIFGL
jgi:predicted TIM-barrel fold metal-dependent hydrolase